MNASNLKNSKKIKIAVIDSGIYTTKTGLDSIVSHRIGLYINEKGSINTKMNMPPRHVHGTAIAMIIKHFCSNIEIISINILNEQLVADGRLLIDAIKKAIKKEVNIIHMSLGTEKEKYILPFYYQILKAKLNGIYLVAAANNNNDKKAYPAYMHGVIGVKGITTKNINEINYDKKFYYAECDSIKIPNIKSLNYPHLYGNSFAAAIITGKLANILCENRYSNNLLGTRLHEKLLLTTSLP